MTPNKLRLVFIGTPDFAVPSLEAIIKADFNVVAVITAPDKPSGRGMKLTPSPVKICAEENKIKVLQPTNLKNPDFVSELASLKADLQIVIAFRMLPEVVWSMPRMGTVNLHASLLPNYRGAAPINWAIMNGETKTGLSTFKLQHEIDTGDLLLQEIVDIDPEENAGSLHDKLMLRGADLMVKTIEGLCTNTLEPKPQKVLENHKTAPKIFKEDCDINWSSKGEDIVNQIRGLSPYPAARFSFQDKVLKVFDAYFSRESSIQGVGHVDSDGKTFMTVQCKNGLIFLKEVQLEGKRKMKIDDFLRGIKLND